MNKIEEYILEEASKVEFGHYFKYNGLTMAEVSNFKNIVTNEVQQIRQPMYNCMPYDMEVAVFDGKTSTIQGYIPALGSIDIVREEEGVLNAYNEFATKTVNALVTFMNRISNTEYLSDNETVEIAKLEEQIQAHNSTNRDLFTKISEIVNKKNAIIAESNDKLKSVTISPKSFMVWLADNGTLANYLIAYQKAAALGNLILSDGGRSNNPRNFLYIMFTAVKNSFVQDKVIYTPIKGLNYDEYVEEFYAVQKEHREQERIVNHYSSLYSDYVNGVKLLNDDIKLNNTKELNAVLAPLDMEINKLQTEKDSVNLISQELAIKLTNLRKDYYQTNRIAIERALKNLRIWIPEEFRFVLTYK